MSVIGATTGIGVDTSRIGSDRNLKAAGERFESVFTGMMLKSMRQAKLADGLFENKASGQFRDMWDQKVAEGMAVTTPLGIGKAMTEFLARSQTVNAPETANSTQAEAQPAVNPSEGKSG
ncbi:rod-binding protein [Sphingomonas sp. 2R-10]|uniref:rod-binding protein n=1 Tax=Sphingomonas sp. 2R-10 TaxID=3045148 RepID=UPI0019D23EBB|nr:rod-binding protein [Sphingomonas sp. 2R-10]MDJ0276544.1 rod-binding protein [Sphingomonas sp. 2R-10]